MANALEEALEMLNPSPPMRLWEVDVERTQTTTVFVLAPTRDAAEDAAGELVDDSFFWEDDGSYKTATQITDPKKAPRHDDVWSGGETGKYVPATEAVKNVVWTPPSTPRTETTGGES